MARKLRQEIEADIYGIIRRCCFDFYRTHDVFIVSQERSEPFFEGCDSKKADQRYVIAWNVMADMEQTDFVVVGAGIAGLRAAIELSSAGRVLVVTKGALDESNTNHAQGGIAVAMGGDEDVALHLEDTMSAGDGLVNREAARVLVEEGPRRVEELLAWGTGFDREAGELMRTREGAHSRNRILHANGDATGAEIGRSLLRRAQSEERITLREQTPTVDLLVGDGKVSGCSIRMARTTAWRRARFCWPAGARGRCTAIRQIRLWLRETALPWRIEPAQRSLTWSSISFIPQR
jgi:hypothetical protein